MEGTKIRLHSSIDATVVEFFYRNVKKSIFFIFIEAKLKNKFGKLLNSFIKNLVHLVS